MKANVDINEYNKAAFTAVKEQRFADACRFAATALKDPRAGHLPRLLFAQSIRYVTLVDYDPLIRNAILAYLDHDGVDHSHVVLLWLSMVAVDPAFKNCVSCVEARKVNIEDWQNIEAALNDPFMTEGLRKLLIRNPAYEVFFRNSRKLALLELWPKGFLKTKHLNFLCALAEQCFVNEFLYDVSEDELRALCALPRDNAIAVAIRGCYGPLSEENINPKLSGVTAFRNMIALHINTVRRERELQQQIPRAEISNLVSQNVQAMYEENPYPRWRSIDVALAKKPDVTGRMLIAGCGTGRTATQTGYLFPNVEITACDITLRSIAYAMRMAEEFGNEGVHFEQRDIMDLDSMQKTFDFVECSGVLHHMADPAAGWKKLVSRLEPDGLMMICLYSTKAREDVKAVRDYIAERKIQPTAENIRKLRAEIIDTKGHPLERITRFRDFYTLSETRDLVFHIQETTYSLPEIRKIADDLGLELYRLKVPDKNVERVFRDMFPEDMDMACLDNWHDFEQAHPMTFVGMYRMVFKRKGAVPGDKALAMVNIAWA